MPRQNHIYAVAICVILISFSRCCKAAGVRLDGNIDWKSLEFKCIHEDDFLAKPDPEAEEWYQLANAKFKIGADTRDWQALSGSVELLLKATERGHIKAMNNLVLDYQNGDGVHRSGEQAVEWAERLMKLNVGRGFYHMGVFLEQGFGVKQDRIAALVYFRKSADLGNRQGQLVVGSKIMQAVARSVGDEKTRGFDIGTSMLRCSLSQGWADAGYELGMHYRVGEERLPEALRAFQDAAKLGHNQSLWALRTIFNDEKDGIPKDKARVACYDRLSAESDADKSKKFPNIDQICPLPPNSMPRR